LTAWLVLVSVVAREAWADLPASGLRRAGGGRQRRGACSWPV